MNLPIPEEDWQELLVSLNEGNRLIVLILGPGLSTRAEDGISIPLTVELARELAAKLPAGVVDVPDQLTHVAGLYQKAKGGRRALEVAVKQFYDRYNKPNSLQQDLAALPFHLIINASPDNLIGESILQRNFSFDQDFYNFQKDRPDCQYDPENPKPFIYHLFGSLQALESLVLTGADQVEFIRQVVQKERKIPNSIQSELVPTKTFLFLGFDFEDWYLRLLLYALGLKGDEEASASWGFHFGIESVKRTTKVFLGNRYKLKILDISPEEFIHELRWRYENPGHTPSDPGWPSANHGDLPTFSVFLLYDEVDRIYKDRLTMALRPLKNHYHFKFSECLPGDDKTASLARMEVADVIFFLITPDFGNNDQMVEHFLPQIIEWSRTKLVVPILTQSCLWKLLPGIKNLPVLPRDHQFINEWNDSYRAWTHIGDEIHQMLRHR